MRYLVRENSIFDREENQSIPTNTSNSSYQRYRQWLSEGNTPDTEEPYIDPQIAINLQERMALENKYLQCSRQICLWAGNQLEDGVYPKLNNVDFEEKSKLAVASQKEEANRIITTMTWCLFELQINHGWSWGQIEYRSL